ncbi:MAG: hypothetical protein LBO05_14825 [Deltaproteobacteria bacterium]|jgi:hypothetical protein|nr:hypothetical protein [Deltaproteobacteria bacterium]
MGDGGVGQVEMASLGYASATMEPHLVLGQLWNKKDYEQFVKLYKESKEHPQAAAWKLHLPYAIHAILTKALFVDHDYDLTKSLAAELAALCDEPRLSLVGDCARMALDCFKVGEPGFEPCELKSSSIVPKLWKDLRRRQLEFAYSKAASSSNRREFLLNTLEIAYGRPEKKYDDFQMILKCFTELLKIVTNSEERKIYQFLKIVAKATRDLCVGRGMSRNEDEKVVFGEAKTPDLGTINHPAVSSMCRLYLDTGLANRDENWHSVAKFCLAAMNPELNPALAGALEGIIPKLNPVFESQDRYKYVDEISKRWQWTPRQSFVLANIKAKSLFESSLMPNIPVDFLKNPNHQEAVQHKSLAAKTNDFKKAIDQIRELSGPIRLGKTLAPKFINGHLNSMALLAPQLFAPVADWEPYLAELGDAAHVSLLIHFAGDRTALKIVQNCLPRKADLNPSSKDISVLTDTSLHAVASDLRALPGPDGFERSRFFKILYLLQKHLTPQKTKEVVLFFLLNSFLKYCQFFTSPDTKARNAALELLECFVARLAASSAETAHLTGISFLSAFLENYQAGKSLRPDGVKTVRAALTEDEAVFKPEPSTGGIFAPPLLFMLTWADPDCELVRRLFVLSMPLFVANNDWANIIKIIETNKALDKKRKSAVATAITAALQKVKKSHPDTPAFDLFKTNIKNLMTGKKLVRSSGFEEFMKMIHNHFGGDFNGLF